MDDYRKGDVVNTTVGECLFVLGHPDVYRGDESPPVTVFDSVSTVAGRRKVRKFLSELEAISVAYGDVRSKVIEEYQETGSDGEPVYLDDDKTSVKMRDGWMVALNQHLSELVEIDFQPFTEAELGELVTFGQTKRLGRFVVTE